MLWSHPTNREIDKSTTLLPPFYVDYGKNIRIGKGCWIQQGCTFFDRGGITIGDGVFIAPKVNLITINHDPNPDNRGSASVLRFCPACASATVLLSAPTAW